MATTFEKERTLTEEIVPRVEHDVPGVDVLAVELLSPARFCVYVDHADGVDHELCERVTDVLRDYLRDYFADAVGSRVKVRMLGSKKLKGEVVSAGENSVTVAVADGHETHIPYAE